MTLAPDTRGEIVTSECGTVLGRRRGPPGAGRVMDDDGRIQRFVGEDLDAAHLAHGYAITVHRAQGATVALAPVPKTAGDGNWPT